MAYESVKNIPGFKVILRAVLKSQIQQLVDQLSAYSDEETVLLTANISEDDVAELGSALGKQFLGDQAQIRAQFLQYCQSKKPGKAVVSRSAMLADTPKLPGGRTSGKSPKTSTSARGKARKGRYKPYTPRKSGRPNLDTSAEKSAVIDTPSRPGKHTSGQPDKLGSSNRAEAQDDVGSNLSAHCDTRDGLNLDTEGTKVKVETIPGSQLQINAASLSRNDDHAEEAFDDTEGQCKEEDFQDGELDDDEIDEADEVEDMKDELQDWISQPDGTTAKIRTSESQYQCEVCEKTFPSSFHVKEHMVVHSGAAEYNCTVCGISYKFRSNLNRHMRSKHSRRSFPCTFCRREFSRKDSLLFHNVSFHKEELEKHHSSFVSSGDSLSVSSKGLQEMSVGKSQDAISLELESLEYLRKVEGMGLFCEYCGKMFNKVSLLEAHLVVHTKEKRFYCEKCGKGFSCKSGIISHKISKHSASAKYSCNTCGKCFISNSKLERHKLTHSGGSGKKGYSCSECTEKCATWQDLITHMQEAHLAVIEKVEEL